MLRDNTKDKLEVINLSFKTFRNTAFEFWRSACRNCFVAGRGLVGHNFSQCSKAGNKCELTCPKCKKGKHWIFECKE